MKITLYKKCILTNTYSEVIDNRVYYNINNKLDTTLNHYLSNLDSFSITLDEVYQTNSGTFVFEMSDGNEWASFYEFNYMKCEQGDFVRYCFIDDIVIGNGCVFISYSEDVWSSYSKTMNIRRGYLTSAKDLKYQNYEIPIAELPKDYETNQPLQLQKLFVNDDTQYYLFAQGQKYNITSNGQASDRTTFICAFGRLTGIIGEKPYYLGFDECLRCMIAVRNSQDKKYGSADYYEFDNFTIIPKEYFNLSLFDGATNGIDFYADTGIPNNRYGCFTFNNAGGIQFGFDITINSPQITIQPNFKNAGVGTLKTDFGILNNNLPHNLYLTLYACNIDMKILLNYDGNLIDITDDFVVEVPFSSLNGEQMTQRKIENATRLKNGIQGLANGVIDIAQGMTNTTSRITGEKTKYNYGKNGRLTSKNTSISRITENEPSGNQVQQGANEIVNGAWDIHVALLPKYQSTYGNFVLGNNILVAKNGIILKTIIPSNEAEVENIINNFGYEVYEIVGNEVLRPINGINENHYNILKYQVIDLYGDFPQNINEVLKSILINGIKIWYYGVDDVQFVF